MLILPPPSNFTKFPFMVSPQMKYMYPTDYLVMSYNTGHNSHNNNNIAAILFSSDYHHRHPIIIITIVNVLYTDASPVSSSSFVNPSVIFNNPSENPTLSNIAKKIIIIIIYYETLSARPDRDRSSRSRIHMQSCIIIIVVITTHNMTLATLTGRALCARLARRFHQGGVCARRSSYTRANSFAARDQKPNSVPDDARP